MEFICSINAWLFVVKGGYNMKNAIPQTLHFGFFRAFLLLNRDDIEHKIKKLKKSLKPDDARRAQVFEQLLKDSKNTPEFIWKILNDIDSNKLESHEK